MNRLLVAPCVRCDERRPVIDSQGPGVHILGGVCLNVAVDIRTLFGSWRLNTGDSLAGSPLSHKLPRLLTFV